LHVLKKHGSMVGVSFYSQPAYFPSVSITNAFPFKKKEPLTFLSTAASFSFGG